MKVFVTGVGGQLGHDVMNELYKRGIEGVGSDIQSEYSGVQDGSAVTTMPYMAMDITDKAQVERILSEVKPDAVVHCAAWTNVDGAEDEVNRPKVCAINVQGTDNIAAVCKALNCKMMYISTDYVFNGQGEIPWQPDCKDYAPLNYYGETKLGGELAVSNQLEKYFIVRIAWVFGLNGKNFIKTMLNVGKTHDTVRVVNDQIGTPTYTLDLARLLVDMIVTEKYGYYHATNEGGYISWYDFTCEIFHQAGYTTKVVPVSTEEYGLSVAARPFNSRLDKGKLAECGFTPLPDWKDAVRRYMEELLQCETKNRTEGRADRMDEVNKLVSVIMPCYNDGAYIDEAVASVRAQTYEDIELIIIDDGSDDPQTLQTLEKMRTEGTVVLHTNHLRPAGARNAGITAATGKYILPLDSDDTIEPTYIEKTVEVMERNHNIGVVYCHADLFGEQSGPWQLPEYSFDRMLLDNVVFVTALFCREDWEKVGGFRATMKYGMEDYDFWLSILELGKEIYQLPETMFHYRIKPVSRTTRFMEDPEVVRETYRDIYRQHPVLYERYREEYAMILRDAFIDQVFLNRAYQKSLGVLNKLKRIPVARQIIERIVLKK